MDKSFRKSQDVIELNTSNLSHINGGTFPSPEEAFNTGLERGKAIRSVWDLFSDLGSLFGGGGK